MRTIAITLNTSWNIYNFRRPLIKALKKVGFDVICFAPKDDSTQLLKEEEIKCIHIKYLSRKGTNPFKDLLFIRELKSLYKKHKIDLALHFTIKPNIYGSIAASQLGIPSIAVVTGLGYTFLSEGLAAKMAKKLYRYSFNRNSITIFQNPDDRALFLNLNLVNKEKSKVILGSGIDTRHFDVQPSIEKQRKILFIGRLLFDKGIKELLEGFKSFSLDQQDVTLEIVGDIDAGNPASLNESDLKKYDHPQIHFHGFQKDVRSFIKDASVVVLPSYREGLPRTMLESLAMGKPVITTDVAGCREVVDDGKNGFLIEAKNAKALADAFTLFFNLSNPEVEAMSYRSRKLAEEKFDSDIINKQYLEIINQILNK